MTVQPSCYLFVNLYLLQSQNDLYLCLDRIGCGQGLNQKLFIKFLRALKEFKEEVLGSFEH